MRRAQILVIDDETDILELVRYNLTQHGYDVACALSGEAALAQLRAEIPDLIVLDLMLPGLDGLDVCRALKQDPRTHEVPILMLTARSEEADIVSGLELGADDYLTKPFSPRVLLARIKAVLRRRRIEPMADSTEITRGALTICLGRHEVLIDRQPVQLTPTEFGILHVLARRPGWVLTRNQIIDAVQGDDTSVTTRSVDVHIVSLRRKLGPHGACIETIRGVGYRFKEDED